jgi:hypothetical protein
LSISINGRENPEKLPHRELAQIGFSNPLSINVPEPASHPEYAVPLTRRFNILSPRPFDFRPQLRLLVMLAARLLLRDDISLVRRPILELESVSSTLAIAVGINFVA